MKSILYSLAAIILFTGCEKIIDLDINENDSKIVIEGDVTNAPGPYFVKVTRSLALNNLDKATGIDEAVITISDNEGNAEVLQSLGNGLYKTNSLQGKSGVTYSLTVKVGNEEFNAQSTMPDFVPLDSIKVITRSFAGSLDHDFIPVFTDPLSPGNQYRFLLSINDTLMKSHFVLNDDIENGTVNKQHLQNITDLTLTKGDVVKIQMQQIDSKVGLFFTTLAQIADNGPGGGITPNNPPNNISNGALGIFSAHTIQEKSVVIQ